MKCEDKGKYGEICGVVFSKFDAPRRTDADYYHGQTPLTGLPIDMVLDFPVGDELHLIDLGVTKRFLKLLMRLKWSNQMN